MSEKIALYHPQLDTTIHASPGAARLHRRRGWVDAHDGIFETPPTQEGTSEPTGKEWGDSTQPEQSDEATEASDQEEE